MKKIGIIGGAGPLASSLLYETIVEERYLCDGSMPEIVLLNYPFVRGLSLKEKDQNQSEIFHQLEHCIHFMVHNSVEIALLACNTLHLFLQQIPSAIPFCYLPSAVLHTAKAHRHKRLLLLATPNTCRSQLYQLEEIEIITPINKEDQQVVEHVIDHILKGIVIERDARLLETLIVRYAARHSLDGVILGCSDLSVLHHRFPIVSSVPLYDSIKIAAKLVAHTESYHIQNLFTQISGSDS
jgi:aspartate racemase